MASPSRTSRLGWLGPAIVGLGVVVAAIGVVYMLMVRPKAGAVVDEIALGNGSSFVLRAEANSDRNFIELHRGDEVLWQALVPTYGGRKGAPGVAWNETAVSVRVVRGDRAEIFALAMRNGSKLGGMVLAPNHGPIARDASGPVTLNGGLRSFELVSGPDWHQLVGINLATGEGLWRQELGPVTIEAAGVEGDRVWVQQGGQRRSFDTATGSPL